MAHANKERKKKQIRNCEQIYVKIKNKTTDLDDWVGVLAVDPFRPSTEAKCPSSASNKELGAFVKSGMSPLSMPTF